MQIACSNTRLDKVVALQQTKQQSVRHDAALLIRQEDLRLHGGMSKQCVKRRNKWRNELLDPNDVRCEQKVNVAQVCRRRKPIEHKRRDVALDWSAGAGGQLERFVDVVGKILDHVVEIREKDLSCSQQCSRNPRQSRSGSKLDNATSSNIRTTYLASTTDPSHVVSPVPLPEFPTSRILTSLPLIMKVSSAAILKPYIRDGSARQAWSGNSASASANDTLSLELRPSCPIAGSIRSEVLVAPPSLKLEHVLTVPVLDSVRSPLVESAVATPLAALLVSIETPLSKKQ
ncbi:hypothetical protein PsorP6_016953 [Peronosclerospora sorghi]|uniref:Uncharacterized protein n=1 Tax=Peronosclerospora sorghi TaxID=230839 RepID=A0ACC0WBJ0_9STRA|nr:hypothetical protein PsorP6_016953 [Peronosclerospora sorghi]